MANSAVLVGDGKEVAPGLVKETIDALKSGKDILLKNGVRNIVLATGLVIGCLVAKEQPAGAVGALVYSKSANNYYWSWNYRTEQEAVDSAINSCRKSNTDCTKQATFWNQYLVIYRSPQGSSAWSTRSNAEEAKAFVQQYCLNNFNVSCDSRIAEIRDTVSPVKFAQPQTNTLSQQKYEDIGGGWAGAEVTLYRNGILVINGKAVSNARNSATRARVFVVGVDQAGNALFAEGLDLPTACGRWDPSCPSSTGDSKQLQINSLIAKYATGLDIYVEDRNRPNGWERWRSNIKQAYKTYDELPPEVKAAIAAYVGGG